MSGPFPWSPLPSLDRDSFATGTQDTIRSSQTYAKTPWIQSTKQTRARLDDALGEKSRKDGLAEQLHCFLESIGTRNDMAGILTTTGAQSCASKHQ